MVASFVANDDTATANASAGENGCFTSKWKLSADHLPKSSLHFCSACGSFGTAGASASTSWKFLTEASLARPKKSKQNPCNLGLYSGARERRLIELRRTRIALGLFASLLTA